MQKVNYTSIKCQSSNLYNEMYLGKELAEQSEILETVGDQDPSEFYYGQGQDED